jgi:methionine sulfoxide reductase heme-binding subunit
MPGLGLRSGRGPGATRQGHRPPLRVLGRYQRTRSAGTIGSTLRYVGGDGAGIIRRVGVTCAGSSHDLPLRAVPIPSEPFHVGSVVRLSGRAVVMLGALLGILVIAATERIVPAHDQYQTQMRLWLAARATGITAYLVLTVLVALGLILSHPVNQSTWKLSKRLFPWHENLFVFVVSFVVAHVAALILDPYADVGVVGAFIPGLSEYRTVPVAVGSIALYALLLTGLTARYTKALPAGWWLKLHRLSLAVFLLSWAHGMLAGTDSDALRWLYVSTGMIVVAAAAYRYWIGKKRRPTFASSLTETSRTGAVSESMPEPSRAGPSAAPTSRASTHAAEEPGS